MKENLIQQAYQRTDCKKYIDILRNPEVKPGFPITEHAIFSIIDTILGMPDGNLEKIKKSKQLESDLRKI